MVNDKPWKPWLCDSAYLLHSPWVLSEVPIIIQCCSREVQTPRRFIFGAGAWQVTTFIQEALVTEPACDTQSVPSGEDSQRKHTHCVVNHVKGALVKTSDGAFENEMKIILYPLTEECSISAVSRKFGGVEILSWRCWKRMVCTVVASLSHCHLGVHPVNRTNLFPLKWFKEIGTIKTTDPDIRPKLT